MSKGLCSYVAGWNFVDATKVEDVENDERASAIIALNLDKGFVHHIATKTTAKDMWDELLKLYGATEKNSKIALKIKFFRLEMKSSDQLGTFISDMKSIMTQLASIDAKVDPDDAIAILLKSMPLEFDALVTTLTHLPDLTWEGCEAALLEEEQKIRRQNGGSASTSRSTFEQALYANKIYNTTCCGSLLVGYSFTTCILVVMGTKEDNVFNIDKLDGTNFSYWKDQIWDVLVQKKQIQPLKLQGVKPENMENNDWEELDEMCRSTIRLSLSKSVYYNVKDAEGGAYELWQQICDMYDKHLAASAVYWIKKIIDLRMEEGASMNAHMNEFNTIFSELATQKITFEDNVKAMFLLVTLPESWDTFRTSISNSVLADELTSTNVESSLLTKEIN
ncbi:hypothetical protein L7F22_034860 [Adiantum nelumboides]|nr:hypothetical protein [Adiantum nelumboides]